MINLGELQYSNICLDSSNTNDQPPQEEEDQDVEIMCGVAGKILKEIFKDFVLLVKDTENDVLFVLDTEEEYTETVKVLQRAIEEIQGCP